jgi:hypothetical protein
MKFFGTLATLATVLGATEAIKHEQLYRNKFA